jgi:hypothetical protein
MVLKSLLAKSGIEIRQLRALLMTYFRQDLRSRGTFQKPGKSEYVTSNWLLLIPLAIHLVGGLFISLLAISGADVFLYSIVALSYTSFLVALIVLIESANTIFNPSESDIIGHLPISSETLLAAKILNLLSFAMLFAVAANLFPSIMGIWAARSGLSFIPAYALAVAAVSLFIIAIIVSCYGLLMRHISKERFDNFVAWAQAGLTLAVILGYQLLPHLADRQEMTSRFEFRYYLLFYPPAWFAGLTMLLMGNFEPGYALLAALGLGSLAVSVAVAFKKIAADYSQEAIIASGMRKERAERVPKKLSGLFASLLLRDSVERAIFDLVSTYLRRDREIKVRLYPSLATFFFFPLLSLIAGKLEDPFSGVFESDHIYTLLAAEMVPFVSLAAVEGLLFSNHHQASYVFHVAPIEKVSQVNSGFRKAVILHVTGLGFLVLFVFYSLAWRNPLDALLILAPWAILTPAVLVVPFIGRQLLPLSRKYQKGQQTGRNTVILFTSILGMSLILLLQAVALRGLFSYQLLLILSAGSSALLYKLLRWLSRESRSFAALGPIEEV